MLTEFKEKFPKYKKELLGIFAAYCVVHMYYMTNIITNHDDVATRYFGYYDMTYLGRWVLAYINKITFYTLNSNWSVGLLSCILLAVGIILINDMLSFENETTKMIASLLMVSFPAVASWNLYAWMTFGFALGFVLAVIAAFFLYKTMDLERRVYRLIGLIASAILLSLSLGCYQSFVCIYFILIWYLVLQESLSLECKWKNIVKYILYGVVAFVISYIIYYITLQIMLNLKDISLTTYQGISDMGKVSLSGTISGIKLAFTEFWRYYKNGYGLNFFRFINIFVLIGLVLVAGYELYKADKEIGSKVIIAMFMIIMPLIINSIYILTQGKGHVYSCMYFTYVFPYLLLLRAMERMGGRWKKYVTHVVVCFVIFFCFMIDNRAYSNQEAVLNNVQQYFNRVAMRIESVEGFSGEETKVYYSNPISITQYPVFQGSGLDTTDSLQGIVYNDSGVHAFMEYFCGFYTGSILGEDELVNEILESEEYANMGTYPDETSIQFIRDVLIVKFK